LHARPTDQAVAYALVVGAQDADAAASSDMHALFVGALGGLGPQFATLPKAARVGQLRAIESGAFFQSVRLKNLLVLYNNSIHGSTSAIRARRSRRVPAARFQRPEVAAGSAGGCQRSVADGLNAPRSMENKPHAAV
jgi:hypothetical protein